MKQRTMRGSKKVKSARFTRRLAINPEFVLCTDGRFHHISWVKMGGMCDAVIYKTKGKAAGSRYIAREATC